jgi:hypothetical protein
VTNGIKFANGSIQTVAANTATATPQPMATAMPERVNPVSSHTRALNMAPRFLNERLERAAACDPIALTRRD